MADDLKNKYAEADRIEQHRILTQMSKGAHLYVGDQPFGPDSDVYGWTANLGVSRDDAKRRVMGRDLRKMQERHWITYDRTLDEFLLTEEGRAVAEQG